MADFLLEIGTEEIPARFIEPEKEAFLKLFTDGLVTLRIDFKKIDIQATPRRLAVYVKDMADMQKEAKTVKFGPPVHRAFDASGNPTNAAIGFAKSQGVTIDALKKDIKDGIEFVIVEKIEKGLPSKEVLPELIKSIISQIPFQKKMRWAQETMEYARPIQWILALFDEEIIKFEIAGVKSSNFTWCHRFLSKNPVEIKNPHEYRDRLRKHYIIIDESERMDIIEKGIDDIEKRTNGIAYREPELLKEILYITEYPYPLLGTFDESFLKIPKEVLINVMKSHQKYIPLKNHNGNLIPYFIFFANTVPKEDANVIKGNEKVLKARLADASFFFEEDTKTNLEELYNKLSSIIFHVKLGTLKQKVDRITEIGLYISDILNYEDKEKLKKAVHILKSDLLTHMVGEFPELQGTMGRIYAQIQGYDEDIATAIEEHYLPSGVNSNLPETTLGSILAIADKIDSLVAFFSVGILPTGNLDPYALRRQALGIIKITINKSFKINIEDLITCAYNAGSHIQERIDLKETKRSLIDFIQTRFKFSMIEEGHRQDFVEGVLDVAGKDIYDAYRRLIALEGQKSIEEFEKLMIGFKRVFNITKQITDALMVNPGLFKQDEERLLFELYTSKKDEFFDFIDRGLYSEALTVLISFKENIDRFFDNVFVMDKDEKIRNNRLALLKNIKDMFLRYSDLSKIRID
ncbi:MAG: glycine--tRNA ligase subunit beta [Syntrophorhabdaceae bacterium]|nr:glycine--tRNA ligase subunit beta [Syntrophorhabdaceae bacterium]